MQDELQFPQLEVAVAVIVQGEGILSVYNPLWGTFTLPMTKRRKWDDENVPAAHREEDWRHAAARAAAEWLGCTVRGLERYDAELAPFQQSDRNGVWKRYTFQVFRLRLADGQQVQDGITQWLTGDEFLDADRLPISRTARHILGQLKADAEFRGVPFP